MSETAWVTFGTHTPLIAVWVESIGKVVITTENGGPVNIHLTPDAALALAIDLMAARESAQ